MIDLKYTSTANGLSTIVNVEMADGVIISPEQIKHLFGKYGRENHTTVIEIGLNGSKDILCWFRFNKNKYCYGFVPVFLGFESTDHDEFEQQFDDIDWAIEMFCRFRYTSGSNDNPYHIPISLFVEKFSSLPMMLLSTRPVNDHIVAHGLSQEERLFWDMLK